MCVCVFFMQHTRMANKNRKEWHEWEREKEEKRK